MEKASRSLEITIISAEGLRLDGRSVKKNVFVIVRTDSQNQRSTSMESKGGIYPTWNEKLEPLSLPNTVPFITVEVQCMMSSSSRVRIVGTAKIPVSEFIGDNTPAQFLHFLSYRLRDRNGERNGIINFSIKTIRPNCLGLPVPPLLAPILPPRRPCLATMAASENQRNAGGSGTALGIPVPYAYGYGM
ncbi:hypothetical protein NE237_014125 [Protea cynaroides]|uniref:C2 domain-containing protein n=1 Tax=Protea cynaroides TaxID=273540 RepID=A0A9Q0H4A0_9MAGN|nr:hypothetical protein NE237_014125 [Protea cynaroides]